MGGDAKATRLCTIFLIFCKNLNYALSLPKVLEQSLGTEL